MTTEKNKISNDETRLDFDSDLEHDPKFEDLSPDTNEAFVTASVDSTEENLSPKTKSWLMVAAFAVALAAIVGAAFFLQTNLADNYDMANVGMDADISMVGEKAPDFSFMSEQGHVLLLSDYVGTPVVLNFWASWCPPCRMEKPFFQQAYDLYGNDFEFIMLNVDEPIEVARKYMDQEGYTFPIYFDESNEGASSFGLTGVPETFFIDADGIIRARFMGAINLETIERALETISQ